MRTANQVGLVLLTVAMSADLAAQADQPKLSVVTFEFVASIGQPLSGRFVLDSSNGRLHDGKVTGELTLSLPYGKYLALYQDDFFSPVSREVIVDQPEALFVLSEPLNNFVSDSSPDPFAISVRVQPVKPWVCIRPTPPSERLVRTVSLFSMKSMTDHTF